LKNYFQIFSYILSSLIYLLLALFYNNIFIYLSADNYKDCLQLCIIGLISFRRSKSI